MLIFLLLDVAAAYVLDLLLGDPSRLPHPVRFIGWMIKNIEGYLRKRVDGIVEAGKADRMALERAAGMLLMLSVVTFTFIIVLVVQKAAVIISPVLFHIVNIYFIYSSLAAKCLGDEAKKVYKVLCRGDISESRKQLAMLVGRQTQNLTEKEIIRGVVETTAENTVDGIISPLIYAVLGSFFGLGAPLVYAFKAVSTLDSMVGYMNERYINMGRASAKTDDAANYIPARLSGILIPAGALLCGKSFRKSFSIMLRDRRNHKSPNCAYPEAAVAGALGVRLGGANVYFGQVVEKPTIGDEERELVKEDILQTVRIMYAASFLTVLSAAVISFVVLMLINNF